jgi:hypothetical protein
MMSPELPNLIMVAIVVMIMMIIDQALGKKKKRKITNSWVELILKTT